MRFTKSRGLWLLLSDIHFRANDLDRIQRTARWIEKLPQHHNITRIVICGDLLSSRTNQPTHVLSACYHFLSNLIDASPRVNVLLGNHDLAHKRDYTTSALEALKIRRLSPFVELHSEVGSHDWDGRRVLTLPFREDQTELTSAVSRLEPLEAAETVAFAHLAIHKAVTQRHVIRPLTGESIGRSVTHQGITGPGNFASLARTFTGHFHSHQTLMQPGEEQAVDPLRGSVTYLGSPLQLTWADLNDEQRGVVLLDPATLHYELLVNPHAVDFTTADLDKTLRNELEIDNVTRKHVMLVGDLTQFKYLTARDKLLGLGARSVRNWSPMSPLLQTNGHQASHVLGVSVPISDYCRCGISSQGVDITHLQSAVDPRVAPEETGLQENISTRVGAPETEPTRNIDTVDLAEHAQQYVEALQLEPPLANRTRDLALVGVGLIRTSGIDSDASAPSYQDILQAATSPNTNSSSTVAAGASNEAEVKRVFVAQPRTLTITNFLGIQEAVTIRFKDVSRGVTFVVGANGSGKSTLLEAITWCQFGRCIRNGLVVNDVVNDVVGKNCSVSLDFENGYTISRHRKHKKQGNRVIVTLHGEEQTHLEKEDLRNTQAAIDDLLGIDYDTYIRTVVLGHENVAGFLSSTALQRRELIESLLRLSKLDELSNISKRMVKDFDIKMGELQSQRERLGQTITHIQGRVVDMRRRKKQLQMGVASAAEALNVALEDKLRLQGEMETSMENMLANQDTSKKSLAKLHEEADEAQRKVDSLKRIGQTANVRIAFDSERSKVRNNLYDSQRRLHDLRLVTAGIKTTFSLRWRIALGTQNTLFQFQRWLNSRTSNGKASVFKPLRYWFETNCLAAVNFIHSQFQLILSGMAESRQQATLEQLQQDEGTFVQEIQRYEAALQHLNKHVALVCGLDEEEVLQSINDMTLDQARDIAKQYSAAENRLSRSMAELDQAMQQQLHQEHTDRIRTDRLRERLTQLGDSVRHLQNSLTNNKGQVDTYNELLMTEEISIKDLQQQEGAQDAQLEQLAASRELFAFWEAASSRRHSKGMNSSTGATFRSYVLSKSLGELNSLLSQILTLLYDDTHHARGITSGILRSLYQSDDEKDNEDDNKDAQIVGGGVINKTLDINSALSYAKRSGGERKRIDLALYFSLLQLSHSRSYHRAQYLLVDEVFDGLDAAGQAVVLRWCRSSMARMAFVLVVTHSEYMVREIEEGEGCSRIRARMGINGTVFDLDGRFDTGHGMTTNVGL